ncbi:MAG: hypothetical protein ACXVQX_04510 [Actinomycetota bacterium]
MPTGTVKWIDPRTGDGCIRHLGQDYPVRIEEVEPVARVPRARVHFDVRRDHGVRHATNVTLQVGKRVSNRRHGFGNLVGAARPDAKGHAPLTHQHPELDLDPGPQPIRVVRAWLDAMFEKDLPTALLLYAQDARLHAGSELFVGGREIEPHLAESPLLGSRARDVEISGEDRTVIIRWQRTDESERPGQTRLRIQHDRIAEQWL